MTKPTTEPGPANEEEAICRICGGPIVFRLDPTRPAVSTHRWVHTLGNRDVHEPTPYQQRSGS